MLKILDKSRYFWHVSDRVIDIVAVCRISKDGKLLAIKEVSDIYRYFPYFWDEY